VSGGTPIFLSAAALFLCREPPCPHGQVSPSPIGLGECPRSHEPSSLELLEDLARPEVRCMHSRCELRRVAGPLLQGAHDTPAHDGLRSGSASRSRARSRSSGPHLSAALPRSAPAGPCASSCTSAQGGRLTGSRSHHSMSSPAECDRGHVVLAGDSAPPPLADMCQGCSAEAGHDDGLPDPSTELLPAGEIVDSPGPVSQIA